MWTLNRSKRYGTIWMLVIVLLASGCGASSQEHITEAEVTTDAGQSSTAAQTENEVRDTSEPAATYVESAPAAEQQVSSSAKEEEKESRNQKEQEKDKPASSSASKPAPTASKPAVSQSAAQQPSVNSEQKPEENAANTAPSVAEAVPVQAPVVQPKPEKQTQTVTISIVGDQEAGTILSGAEVAITEGASVFDVLKQAAKENDIQMEHRGRGMTIYIEGIDNLYEFDLGAKSGWTYKVNGKYPGESAGAYKLEPGDQIEWIYSLDYMKDQKAGAE